MALLSATGVRADPLLNHNFVVSLVDSSSTLGALGALAGGGILDVAARRLQRMHGPRNVDAARGVQGGRSQRRRAQVSEPDHVDQPHAEEGNRHRHRTVGLALRVRRGHGAERRDGVDHAARRAAPAEHIWFFRRGLPVKYTGPSLNATQNNVAIEAIEIAHEGIHQVAGVGGFAAAAGTIAGLVG